MTTAQKRLELGLVQYNVGLFYLMAQFSGLTPTVSEAAKEIGITTNQVSSAISDLESIGYMQDGEVTPFFAEAHVGEVVVVDPEFVEECQDLIDALNRVRKASHQFLVGSAKPYRPIRNTQGFRSLVKKLRRQLPQKYTSKSQMIGVIENAFLKWGKDEKMAKYIRATTLFNPSPKKYPTYLEEAEQEFGELV